MTKIPNVRVVILAFGEEPYLGEAVDSALASVGVSCEVVIVDNGCTSHSVEHLPQDDRITVLRPGRNLGFAGGVNLGAEGAATTYLALLNSDAKFAPDALHKLVEAASAERVGIASGSIRLADQPELINSAGNPVHVIGLSWAGGFGEPASSHAVRQPIASASGAGLAMRTSLWRKLGGFTPEYFAYHEDVDLSWRTWQAGHEVIYVPDAVVTHHYEFTRNPLKLYLLERNRQIFLKTLYGRRLRILTWLPAQALEVAMTAVAHAQGWGDEKKRARSWIRENKRWLVERRNTVQSTRIVGDREVAALLTATLDPAVFPLPRGSGFLNSILRAYWSVAKRLL